MTPDPDFPEELELRGPGEPEKAVRVGPSMQGWIYRARLGSAWYRLLPIDQSPLQRRQQIQAWIDGQVRPDIARLTHAQQLTDGTGCYMVRYEVQAAARTLADVLHDPDFLLRLDHVIKALQALPTWWEQAYRPLLPMPADIVFTRDGAAILLALPQWRLPEVGAVFAVPERALYLAPELIRGHKGLVQDALDRYSLGVALLHCFYSPAFRLDTVTILQKAADGTVFEPRNLISNSPYWLDRVEVFHQALAIARRLVHIESQVRKRGELPKLVAQLERLHRRMAPLVAARELRNAKKASRAISLLQDVLLQQGSYELLLLAGEIAGRDLDRPTEAIDLFERAISREPHRWNAYLAQLKVLTGEQSRERLKPLIDHNQAVARQIDDKVDRDFQALSRDLQGKHETDVASYLLWRRQYDRAAGFIYSHLFEGQHFLWWKFELNLLYAEVLMAQQRLGDAQSQLNSVRAGLRKVQQNKTVSESEILWHGGRLAELDRRLFSLKRRTRRATR